MHEPDDKSTSRAWWLLPFVMGVIGGIIAWEVIRERDRQKGLRILILGIAITLVTVVVSVVAAANSVEDEYDDPLEDFIIPTSEMVTDSWFA